MSLPVGGSHNKTKKKKSQKTEKVQEISKKNLRADHKKYAAEFIYFRHKMETHEQTEWIILISCQHEKSQIMWVDRWMDR